MAGLFGSRSGDRIPQKYVNTDIVALVCAYAMHNAYPPPPRRKQRNYPGHTPCRVANSPPRRHVLSPHVPTTALSWPYSLTTSSLQPPLVIVARLRGVFPMEVILTAIMGEIVNRSISFCLDKYSKKEDTRFNDLERLLRRAHTIINEAEGRLITNRAMVYQLNILRKEMYRGYFTMDRLKKQSNDAKGHDVSHSCPLSNLMNATKRISVLTDDTHRKNEVEQLICNLNEIISDANELVIFLGNHSPMYRQPYNMHLTIGKCMFGRHMEMDRIMDFLMQKEHQSNRNVGILPITGPGYVGKSTLMAHICNDTRVRNHFSRIVLVNGDVINGKMLNVVNDGCMVIHQSKSLVENERTLAVIEFSEKVDKVAWESWNLSLVGHLVRGSKIIITSKSDEIRDFGTAQALRLNLLPLEAFWYFFKILIFGSADPSDHPKLESIAMEMAREMNGSFLAANIISGILRDNFSNHYWSLYHAVFKENIQRNVSLFGEHPYELMQKQKPACYLINNDRYMVCAEYLAYRDGENVPSITMRDVVSGNVKCEGAFKVLALKSQVLPRKSYIISCMIEKAQRFKRMHYTRAY
ncbi:hypothetical protein EJB05_14145, partial [Eragrostis curvula]